MKTPSCVLDYLNFTLKKGSIKVPTKESLYTLDCVERKDKYTIKYVHVDKRKKLSKCFGEISFPSWTSEIFSLEKQLQKVPQVKTLLEKQNVKMIFPELVTECLQLDSDNNVYTPTESFLEYSGCYITTDRDFFLEDFQKMISLSNSIEDDLVSFLPPDLLSSNGKLSVENKKLLNKLLLSCVFPHLIIPVNPKEENEYIQAFSIAKHLLTENEALTLLGGLVRNSLIGRYCWSEEKFLELSKRFLFSVMYFLLVLIKESLLNYGEVVLMPQDCLILGIHQYTSLLYTSLEKDFTKLETVLRGGDVLVSSEFEFEFISPVATYVVADLGETVVKFKLDSFNVGEEYVSYMMKDLSKLLETKQATEEQIVTDTEELTVFQSVIEEDIDETVITTELLDEVQTMLESQFTAQETTTETILQEEETGVSIEEKTEVGTETITEYTLEELKNVVEENETEEHVEELERCARIRIEFQCKDLLQLVSLQEKLVKTLQLKDLFVTTEKDDDVYSVSCEVVFDCPTLQNMQHIYVILQAYNIEKLILVWPDED